MIVLSCLVTRHEHNLFLVTSRLTSLPASNKASVILCDICFHLINQHQHRLEADVMSLFCLVHSKERHKTMVITYLLVPDNSEQEMSQINIYLYGFYCVPFKHVLISLATDDAPQRIRLGVE